MQELTFVVFALMEDGMPVKHQVLAVPMRFAARKFAPTLCLSYDIRAFVHYLCHTYREHERDIGSIHSLMDYAGITTDYGKMQHQIHKAFNEQLSTPQWVNLITAVSDDDMIAGSSDMVRWFALKDKALNMCLPGAFGRWEKEEAPILRGDDGIVDTGGLGWLFSGIPVQPSQPSASAQYRYWVSASYEFGTLDAALFAGISCLARIPWMSLYFVSMNYEIAGLSASRLLFHGLYPDGSCNARIYDWFSEPAPSAYDKVLYSALPLPADPPGEWRCIRSQKLTLNQM